MRLQDILHALIDHVSVSEDLRRELHDGAEHVLVTATVDENGKPGLRFADAREENITIREPEAA